MQTLQVENTILSDLALKARSDSRRLLLKRIFLLSLLLLLPANYIALTDSRYIGQGLNPVYFRFSNISDGLSVFTALLMFLPTIVALVRPQRIGLIRSGIALSLSIVLLWLEFGVKRFDASDFSPLASITLLACIFMQIAVVLTPSNEKSSRFKRILRVFGSGGSIFLLYLAFGFTISFGYPVVSDPPEITHFGADAGIVFGAAVWSGNNLGSRPSPTLKERIDVGYDLLASKAIPRLVVTGANAPGELTEAEVAKREFIKRGVDASAIIPESGSHSTLEQVRYIRDELEAKQGWSKFVVISDQYHLARILEMCKFNKIQAIGTPSKIQQPFLELAFYRARESFALVAYWLLGK